MKDSIKRDLAIANELGHMADARIKELEAEREALIYWLLRAYQSGHRQGWEPGASTDETMDDICSVLANRGYDPNLSAAATELLKTKPKF